MGNSQVEAKRIVSAMELLSIAGFAFLVGWMLVSFYWLFCDFPPGVPVQTRDFTQFWIFLGIPAGYLAVHAAGRSPKFNLFAAPVVGAELVCGVLLAATSFAMYNGVGAPLFVVCVVNFLAGLASAGLTVSWLDVSSRLRTTQFGRFTGLAFAGGCVLFALAALSPEQVQPMFSLVFLLCSVGLLVFATERADGNEERAPLESVANTWKFTKEIEPSFFMFGIVFALSFVYLFNYGRLAVLAGLIAVLPGALIVALMSIFHRELGITFIQRILTFVTVAACIVVPFVDTPFQIACSCVVIASWALFTCVNYAFVVKKSVRVRETPFFRQAPMRLAVAALGFAVGWGLATAVTYGFGAGSGAFAYTTLRLVMAIALVAVVMLFFPVAGHHNVDGTSESEGERVSTVVNVSMSEQELFEARCDAIAKLYQLSPRESDILRYLAKGRNAAYLQEKLTISPHTVKSHIYNIYRKLDIHSQQKLMDFVEDFPLDL